MSMGELVVAASEEWKSFFNAGDAAGCASCYEETAVMTASPMGTFKGRAEIQALWQQLIDDGYTDVDYVEPTIEEIDPQSAVLSSGWTMNKAKGVITRELWVLQEDGSVKLRDDQFEVQV